MKYVQLGQRRVSAIGLGTWQFGSADWGWGRDFGPGEASLVVQRSLDLGITFFDTAEIYGQGRSEEILGAALREAGADVTVATKVWPTRITPGAVVEAARRSLRRLGREAIDLYQVHWPNPVVPLSWTVEGLRRLIDAGLVREVGVSNFSLSRWRKAEQLLGGPVVANQVLYHLLHRQPEQDLIPYAAAAGRSVIAYSPLGQGLLAGTYGPGFAPAGARAWNPLFEAESLERSQSLISVLRAVGAEQGATPAQVALAWTIRHRNVIAIPGARRVQQVEENAAAAEIELKSDQVDAIESAAARVAPSRPKQALRFVRLLASRLRPRRRP